MSTPWLLIPAFRPRPEFVDWVSDFRSRASLPVCIVDDGSGPDFSPIFKALAEIPQVVVVVHEKNRGKGAALKTGMGRYLELASAASIGVVTADSDGQHAVADIKKVADAFQCHPGTVIFGVREFGSDVPFKNRWGNGLTRRLFAWVSGLWVSDTQTGLRAIPRDRIPGLLLLPQEHFDFEMMMLLKIARENWGVREVPIATLYPKDRTSHFRAIRDSLRIYWTFFRR